MLLLTTSLCLTTVFVAVQSEKECVNYSHLCNGYKDYCGDGLDEQSWMKRNCPKTCGYCKKEGKKDSTEQNDPYFPGCGIKKMLGTRIIGGKNAIRGSWPWQIMLFRNGMPICGGSLISAQWVITAGHCINDQTKNPQIFKVRVGEYDLRKKEGSEMDFEVEKIIQHPDYLEQAVDNDIGLLKLKRPVMFNRFVSPVCLPNTAPSVGEECFITGWGKRRFPGRLSAILQQGKMKIVDKKACHALNYKNLEIAVTDSMICAGDGGKTSLSGCHGDSGSPLVCNEGGRWVLQGSVSYGSPTCKSRETYTVFARISHFKSWIARSMKTN